MRERTLWTMGVLVGAAAVLTACGSKSIAKTSAKSSAAVELSQCMRSHGVPNFPDPSANGTIDLAPSLGINPASPAFQTAQRDCKRYAPSFGGVPAMSASERRAAVRFAACMRANGQPDFRDPTLTPPPGSTRMLALRGMFFALGPGGIDPKSPAFRQAATRCGVTPP